MTKIISIIVVLVIIILAATSLQKKSDDKKIDESFDQNMVSSNTIITPTTINLSGMKVTDGSYTISPADTKIVWTGRKVVLKNWVDSGTIALKESKFEIKDNAIVSNSFVIDMTTILGKTTGAGGGEDKLTTHLKSADFFDVAQFPTSTFVAKEITANADGKTYTVKGDMTIKGVTNEISIPTTFTPSTDGKSISVHGAVDLDRSKWNVKYASTKFFQNLGDKVIDDMFNITFDLKMKI